MSTSYLNNSYSNFSRRLYGFLNKPGTVLIDSGHEPREGTILGSQIDNQMPLGPPGDWSTRGLLQIYPSHAIKFFVHGREHDSDELLSYSVTLYVLPSSDPTDAEDNSSGVNNALLSWEYISRQLLPDQPVGLHVHALGVDERIYYPNKSSGEVGMFFQVLSDAVSAVPSPEDFLKRLRWPQFADSLASPESPTGASLNPSDWLEPLGLIDYFDRNRRSFHAMVTSILDHLRERQGTAPKLEPIMAVLTSYLTQDVGLMRAFIQRDPIETISPTEREIVIRQFAEFIVHKTLETQRRPLKVFLSHVRSDSATVREMYQQLGADGFDVWLDTEALQPGQHWQSEIEKAISESDVAIVCISSNSTKGRGFMQKEIQMAFAAANTKVDGATFVIPVRLDSSRLPSSLAHHQWLDYFSKDGHENLRSVLEGRARSLDLLKV